MYYISILPFSYWMYLCLYTQHIDFDSIGELCLSHVHFYAVATVVVLPFLRIEWFLFAISLLTNTIIFFSSLKIAVKSLFHLRLHYSQYRAAHHDTHVSMVFFVFILSRISMLCLVKVHYELCRIFLTFSKRRTIFFLFWTIFTVSGWF